MEYKKIGFSLLITTVLFAGSCDKRPDGVLSDKEMVSLLTDMQLAESYSEMVSRGVDYRSARRSIADGVLAAHGVTQQQLDISLEWYGKNLDLYNELFQKVDKEIDKRHKQLMKDSGMPEITTADDMWPFAPHIVISPLGSSDNLSFSIPAEGLTKGDVLIWKLRLNSSGDFIGLLGVDYSDGSSGLVNRNLMGTPSMEIRLQTDTAKTPTRIFGVLRVRQSRFSPVWADSISLISEPFDSTRYYSLHSVSRIHPLRPRPAKEEIPDSISDELSELSSEVTPGMTPLGTSVSRNTRSSGKTEDKKMRPFGMPDVHAPIKTK